MLKVENFKNQYQFLLVLIARLFFLERHSIHSVTSFINIWWIHQFSMIFGPHTYLFMIIEDKLITTFIDRIIIYRNISSRKCFCFLHSQRNGNHYFYLDYIWMLPCSMLLFLVRPINIHRWEINGYFPKYHKYYDTLWNHRQLWKQTYFFIF